MTEEKKKKKKIPDKKLKSVDELINLINNSRSVIIVSIKNLPSNQFQLIKKKLREDAVIRVVKKNIISRAIDGIEKGFIKNFKNYLKEDTALIFSKLEPFELSAILSKNKSMSRAKIGQIVNQDIEIESGPTELVPGPVISDLGALGIKFAIEDGKIGIKEKKIILKAGEQVNEQAASIMGKLDIKPIPVGLEPLIAYDSKEDKIYRDIKIDSEETLEELREGVNKALALAIKIAYVCKESIGFLLRKANAEEKVLESKIKKEKEGTKTDKKETEKAEELEKEKKESKEEEK